MTYLKLTKLFRNVYLLKMRVASCGCCYERPSWLSYYNKRTIKLGRYVIIFDRGN